VTVELSETSGSTSSIMIGLPMMTCVGFRGSVDLIFMIPAQFQRCYQIIVDHSPYREASTVHCELINLSLKIPVEGTTLVILMKSAGDASLYTACTVSPDEMKNFPEVVCVSICTFVPLMQVN